MSTKDPNMKVIIGADTHDFDKGAKAVKQGLKDLDKTGNQAMSALGEAFGVNTGKVGQMASAITGLGQKMSQCGSSGVAAFGNILKAIGPVGGAIAGLGISAAIAGFRELQKEADAFKNTVEGANIEMATAAYVDTYKQILRDFNGDTGKALAETEGRFKKFWGTLGITMRELFTTGAWMGTGTVGGAQAVDEYTRRISEANAGAKTAEELTNQIYALERRRKEQAVELARLNDDIATQMNVAKDATSSVAERQDAVYKIELMLSQKKAMTVSLEERLAELYRQRSNLATDSVTAADATLAQEARAYEASRAITQEQNSLLRVKSSIATASEKLSAELRKQREEMERINATQSKWAAMKDDLSALSSVATPTLPGVLGPEMSIIIHPKVDKNEAIDLSNELASLIEQGTTSVSESIGSLIGDLATGGDAWANFATSALSAFGDMAIAVGKMAIGVGVATLGIKKALESLNGYVAIAAGAALVALGAAVKSGLSNVASGDYSAAGGGYSGSYASSGGGDGYETREVQVNVTGTLVANGDQLVTVINNTNKKNYYLGGE